MSAARRQRVSLPDTRVQAGVRVERALGRMRTTVHPDCRDVLVDPRAHLPGHYPRRGGVDFVPNIETEGTEHDVRGRVVLALTFLLRLHRRGVTQGLDACRIVNRNPRIIDQARTAAVIEPIYVPRVRPSAGEIDLSERGTTYHRQQNYAPCGDRFDNFHIQTLRQIRISNSGGLRVYLKRSV